MRRLMGFRKSGEEAKVRKIISVPTSEKQEAIRSMVSSAGIGLSLAWPAMIEFLPGSQAHAQDSKGQVGASEP